MENIENKDQSRSRLKDIGKGWGMIFLSFSFIVFYALALFRFIQPLPDNSPIQFIQPIVFLLFGFFLGRTSLGQIETVLTKEIERQERLVDAARHASEYAQKEREAFEEKIKNAKTTLQVSKNNLLKETKSTGEVDNDFERSISTSAIETAIKILDS